jgi:transposase-like protein
MMAKPVTCSDQLFKGRQFEREIIILCVRWYLRFKLSFRDLVEMMAERGVSLAHTTIMRWVQRFVPEFERRWNRFARQSGQSWRVDETYIKIRGVWTYLYRAVDRNGKTVDFRLSPHRDVAAAKSFFRKALKTQGRPPCVITLDGYAASHRAVGELAEENGLWKDTKLRSSKYLNNIVEQDHRGVKARIGQMLGFKKFRRAKVTIAGIELLSTASAKTNSTSANCQNMPKPHLRFGTPCLPHDQCQAHRSDQAQTRNLHQSRLSIGATNERRG